MALTDKLTTAKSELESYLDSVRGSKLEQNQIDRLFTLNGLLGVGAVGGVVTGLLPYRNTALTNTSSQIKAAGGQTWGWNLINPNTIPVYVKFYDAFAASVVVGTTAIVKTLAIPAAGAFYLEAQSVSQIDFTTAISISCVTGLIDSNATAPAIAIHAEVRYK